MKLFLLTALFIWSSSSCSAQEVSSLPPGKYETTIRNSQDKWSRGDITILDDTRYRISSTNEEGMFRFSVTAQRLFFTSGPLKSYFAKTAMEGAKPVIIFPVSENEQMGMKLPSEVRGYYKF